LDLPVYLIVICHELLGQISMNESPLQCIVGEQLSSVTFVQDYLQLHFDGPGLNAYTPIVIRQADIEIGSADTEFRNAICRQIAKKVVAVNVIDENALVIEFADQSSISISLKDSDYVGPEAVYFFAPGLNVVI
jgi:hypothetical protein